MKNTRALLLLAALMIIPIFARAQAVDSEKVNSFAHGVALAEGFHVPHSLPARNHNPGDIKKGDRYIHFRNDAEGWAALRTQVTKLAAGQSKHYRLSMTINQVSKIYAGDYRWGKIVAKSLGVPPTTTLKAYFAHEEPVAPTVAMQTYVMVELPTAGIVLPILAQN